MTRYSQAARQYESPIRKENENLRQPKINLMPVPREELEKRQKARAILRASRRSQIRNFVAVTALVLGLTGIFGFLLGNQTRLVEMNFANAKITDDIRKLNIENVQKKSELVRLTDLDQIRAMALEMGLQTPIDTQIVFLDVPVQDRLILGSQAQSLKASDEEPMAVRQHIEGFFKTLLP